MSKEIKDITYELIKAIEDALYSKEVQRRKGECPYGFKLHEGRCFCCKECELKGM